ncbi:fumarylacetoacetate hydrolase family protein [Xanthobacter agilis]|uniref:fumarylacetoacetate hydrolase family protein n=1 Tax=Xanthobacter agilis TaxID=47492 RepID=UPI00372A9ACE
MNAPTPAMQAPPLLFPAPALPLVPVTGSTALYPVHRIFCVGRNYAEHAREMGHAVDREAPFYFTKPATAIALSDAVIAYPPGTANYHYEMELVVALGAPAFRVPEADALNAVFGYACGLDMTRRDLQLDARAKGRPWDLGKAFEQSAVIAPITPAAAFGAVGPQRIALTVDGTVRQEAHLSDLVWSVAELVSHLSKYYHLAPGDLIYTGTPAGVGAVLPGARLEGTIDGLLPVRLAIGPAEA